MHHVSERRSESEGGGEGKESIDATEERKNYSSIYGRGVGCHITRRPKGCGDFGQQCYRLTGLAITEIGRNNWQADGPRTNSPPTDRLKSLLTDKLTDWSTDRPNNRPNT